MCLPSTPCDDCKELLPDYAWNGERGDFYYFEWTDCGVDNCKHAACELVHKGKFGNLHDAVVFVKKSTPKK